MVNASARDELVRALREAWHWPSPEAGFAKMVLAAVQGAPIPLGALALAKSERVHLDRAPLLAAAGYAYDIGEAPRALDADWAGGLGRLSERDAIPADHRSFLFEPLELLGIAVGSLRCPVVEAASLRWLRDVVQRLEPLVPARAVWSYLLGFWTAHTLGVPWPRRALPDQGTWVPEERALAVWLSRHRTDVFGALGLETPGPFHVPHPYGVRDPARAALVLVASTVDAPAEPTDAAAAALGIASIRIGIVTALPEEFAAVRAMLDEPVEHPTRKHDDPHPYVLGWIPAADGKHLIAATLAPKMGNNSAGVMAAHLIRTFPKISDVLMVGIAGGIPHPENPDGHVRLGDVVVSDEHGVVQYDNVKLARGKPEFRDTSTAPSAWLVAKIKNLESQRLAGERPWDAWIARGATLERGVRPPESTDVLVDRDDRPIQHPVDIRRIPGQPRIHYGRIASANTLLKRPTVRDALRRDYKARAVEMEGSGVADGAWTSGRGYLLIRGVCDYCDERKNDAWHGYAAVAAAAYAAALIASIRVIEVA